MIKKNSSEIKGRFHLLSLGVFGSSARQEEHASSDVDVLVEFEEEYITFDNFMDLKFYLEDLTGRDVDLATPDVLRPRLKERILKETIYA